MNPKLIGVVVFSLLGCGLASGADKEAVKAYDTGTQLLKQGKNKEALPYFDKAIELEPNYLAAYQNRGMTRAYLRQYDLALADADAALKLKPEFSYAYQLRALVYYRQGKYKEGIEAANEAIRISPELDKAFGTRGQCYHGLSEFKKAIDDYTAALKYAPQNSTNIPNWLTWRGICCDVYPSKREAALQDFDKAIELNPKLAIAYGWRGIVKLQLNKDEEAKKDLEKAYELDPKAKKEFEEIAEKIRAKRNEKK